MMTLILTLAALAQDTQVKLGTLAPEGSPWHTIIQNMGADWKKALDGKLKFQVYPGGVAGDEPDMVRKMRVGQLHAAALTGVGLAEIAPEIMTIQLPLLLRNDEELDFVRDRIAPQFEAILLKKGFVVLNWGEAGWVHFFAQKPVVQLADLAKVKLAVWGGNAGELAAWKNVGANPVPIAAPDIHSALKTGLVTALSTTPLAALSFQWFGQAKEMSDMKWAPLIGATVITQKQWNLIPENAKPALLQSAQKAGTDFRAQTRKQSNVAITEMQKLGLTVHAASPEVVAVWEKQARIAWPALMGAAYPPQLVAQIEALRDQFRIQNNPGK
jgi:TRAP-type C4-dicarboxylate transport system substrate-binding protein